MRILASRALCVLAFVATACSPSKGTDQSARTESRTLEAEILQTGSALIEDVEFDPHAVAWAPRSIRALEQILRLLQRRTEWRFEVQVHTNDSGNGPADRTLSDRRAEALVTWLTEHGIEPSRLVARGYGGSKPLTLDGRTFRERVELKKLNEK
jgi:outer membrane protein OmpA-like peptidoglycan-associated protein